MEVYSNFVRIIFKRENETKWKTLTLRLQTPKYFWVGKANIRKVKNN